MKRSEKAVHKIRTLSCYEEDWRDVGECLNVYADGDWSTWRDPTKGTIMVRYSFSDERSRAMVKLLKKWGVPFTLYDGKIPAFGEETIMDKWHADAVKYHTRDSIAILVAAIAVLLITTIFGMVLISMNHGNAEAREIEPEWTWKVHPSDITNKASANRIWMSEIDEFVNSIIEEYERQKAEEEAATQAAVYEETWYEPVYYDYSYSGYPGGVAGDPNGLNSFVGVVDGPNDTTETAYSSNVLYHYRTSEWTPDEYGFYRTSDGYYVVASNEYEEGTVIETSRGEAMVLDGGCAEGYIDFYTNW